MAFLNEKINLCISNEIITEYEEILAKKTSPQFAKLIVYKILNSNNIILTNPYFRFGLITIDPDDNKYVDCAVASNADYIVSQDNHFDILKNIDFPKVKVIKIEDFIKSLF
jgi:putative PIN family toxin of toxin-antitoxin system